ncbi:Plasmodium variant antigen protein Cir/Yir/Bir, putative, partial [Plasmodium berghei]
MNLENIVLIVEGSRVISPNLEAATTMSIKLMLDVYGYLINFMVTVVKSKTQIGINKFKDFYSNYMESVNEYKQNIADVKEYTSYIDLINKKKELMNISNENMSKLYELFKTLCNTINTVDKKEDGEIYLEYANNFVNKHNELKNNSNNIKTIHIIKYCLHYQM